MIIVNMLIAKIGDIMQYLIRAAFLGFLLLAEIRLKALFFNASRAVSLYGRRFRCITVSLELDYSYDTVMIEL